MQHHDISRRELLRLGLGAGAGLLAVGPTARLARAAEEAGEDGEVSANEDLMREHGMLVRLLLIYRSGVTALQAGAAGALPVLYRAAVTVQRFVCEYHERTEERFVFPVLADGEHAALVRTLLDQHEASRRMTGRLVELTVGDAADLDADDRTEVAALVAAFERMYYPHLAREDTVVFGAFRAALPPDEYQELGEKFEELEHQVLGEHTFERTLHDVAEMEEALGIHDLAQFTPKI